jgi:predicted kinase
MYQSAMSGGGLGFRGLKRELPSPHSRAGGQTVTVTRLLITRGLPGSGKTTFARRLQPWVVRVNRDDLRRMLHGRRLYTPWAEGLVSAVQRDAVERLLEARADVMVDDTNLAPRRVREWKALAFRLGAKFEIHDFTGVPVEECVRRDAGRPDDERVGEPGIRTMHRKYLE